MNVVIYLPRQFYSTAASIAAETLLAMNAVRREDYFDLSFISSHPTASTKLGISFPISKLGKKKIDLLIILAGHTAELDDLEGELEREASFAKDVIKHAQRSNAIIAGTCSASLLMAKTGLLDGKRATVAWWVKEIAAELFPKVKWDASQIIIRQGNVFTSGGVLTAFDLMTTILVKLGFAHDIRMVRKILVAPPSRQLQSVYEMNLNLLPQTEFEESLHKKVAQLGLANLNITSLADELACSEKTLTRRFKDELNTTPGKWIQGERLARARELLETTSQSIAKICSEIGYQDQASFSRLFFKTVGTTPSEFRKQTRM